MMYKIYNKKIKKSIVLCILNIKKQKQLDKYGRYDYTECMVKMFVSQTKIQNRRGD